MANLATEIKNLALLTGTKDPALDAFLESIKSVEIPDSIINGINGGILTKESAKNNSEIIDHIRAMAFNGIDTELERYMTDNKIDDKIVSEIKAEKKTAKRAIMLAEKLKEAEAAKINAKGGEQKVLQEKIDKLNEELQNLNSQIVKEKETFTSRLAEEQQKYFNDLKNYKTNEHYSAYQYAGDERQRPYNIKMARIIEEEKLKELGLKTVFDKETGNIKLLTNTDTIYYKDNKPIDYKTFTDSFLAENHLLKVSETPNKGSSGNQSKIIVQSNGQGDKRDTSRMTEAINKSLAEVSVTQN